MSIQVFVVIGLAILFILLSIAFYMRWSEKHVQAILASATLTAMVAGFLVFLVSTLEPEQPIPTLESAVTPLSSLSITEIAQQPTSITLQPGTTLTPSIEVSPDTITRLETRMAEIQPTPMGVREPSYFQDLRSSRDSSWRIWSDADGRAAYEDGGYTVWSKDRVASWLSANLDDEYENFVLEVDVTPVTYGIVTGYKIAIGWDESNTYYLFLVTSEGKCGIGTIVNQYGSTIQSSECPKPEQGKTVRVRVEVEDKQMRVFIDGEYINSWGIPAYKGGKIGLGTYNGGLMDSGVEAGVKFNNLAIWFIP